MRKALIDALQQATRISGYARLEQGDNVPVAFHSFIPILEIIPNSYRVCDVQDVEFDVAQPFFWVDCEDDVVIDNFYYDIETTQIFSCEHDNHPLSYPDQYTGPIPTSDV